jgi:hypothetical protein
MMARPPALASICPLPIFAVAALAAPPAENAKPPPKRIAELAALARD